MLLITKGYMITERVKVEGKLPNENSVDLIVLDIDEDLNHKLQTLGKEYKSIFPDILFRTTIGGFKKQISQAKKTALSTLLYGLQKPLPNLISSLK